MCGDFYQLPPVKGSPGVLWKEFQMVELTEVMRQRGDHDFIRVLLERLMKKETLRGKH